MKNLEINISGSKILTPTVIFNAETGKCTINGESGIDYPFEFYENLVKWLKSYFKNKSFLELTINLVYYNTGSSKALLEMLQFLRICQDQDKKVDVKWIYSTDDDEEDLFDIEDICTSSGMEVSLIAA